MKHLKAVIFDMDGVLIDSEKFWKQAESEVFGSLGVRVSAEFTALTQQMTTKEVTAFWYEKFPWNEADHQAVEDQVIDRVIELINTGHSEITGVKVFIDSLKQSGIKIGLATNSPARIIPVVLNKLGIDHYFDTVTSADEVGAGKPDPAVYLLAAEKLGVAHPACLAIEDSSSGMAAARSAGMKVAAYAPGNTGICAHEADMIIHEFHRTDVAQLRSILN